MASPEGVPRGSRAATLWLILVGIAVVFLWPRVREDEPDEALPSADPVTVSPLLSGRPSAPSAPGTLEARDVVLPLPADAVLATDCDPVQPPWTLPGYSSARVEELLTAARVSPRVRGLLQAGQRCEPEGCILQPTLDAVQELSAENRAVLYPALGEFAANALYAYPFERRANVMPWAASPALPPAARALLERFGYRHGPFVAFAERPLLCATITDPSERLATLRVQREREATFGDVLVLLGPDGTPAHAANVVTARHAYSKNGGSYLRPWVIMPLDDLRAEYPRAAEIQYWRPRTPTVD